MTPPPSGETDPLATPANPDAISGPIFGVQQMHREIIQEHLEPRDGFEPVPMWLLALFGGMLIWGGYYAGMNSGAFSAAIQDRADPPAVAPMRPPATILTPATAAKP
ncbi:MAG: hypothetical protein LC104_15135 [Bacteroidales bacterium]|nr:hypothetical protein [Bacteroidales bacterium]